MTAVNSQQSESENSVWGMRTDANSVISASKQSVGTSPGTNDPCKTTKDQLEQLQTLREAIFSQDGWGVVSFL